MKKINDITTGIINMEMDADLFIIPNKGCTRNQFIIPDDEVWHFPELEENTIEDWCEIWAVDREEVEETGDSNLSCHGFMVEDFACSYFPFNFPIYMLPEREGETKDIVVRFYANKNGIEYDVNCTLHATARQLEYRYARFGAFEDVLNKI